MLIYKENPWKIIHSSFVHIHFILSITWYKTFYCISEFVSYSRLL